MMLRSKVSLSVLISKSKSWTDGNGSPKMVVLSSLLVMTWCHNPSIRATGKDPFLVLLSSV